MDKYLEIAKKYWIDGDILEFRPFGSGHINSTFVIRCKECRYLFQKINTNVFKNPLELMKNVDLVTSALSRKIRETGGDGQVMSVIRTKDGELFKTVNGESFRVYSFIENTVSFDVAESAEDLYNLGLAFGKFAMDLDGLDASGLYEVIPDFHNTVNRYEKFMSSLGKDAKNRASSCPEEIEFYRSRKNICGKITSLLESGKMPLRVTHNDTKMNNVLFSNTTGKPVAIVDLDTVMPGSVCYDFGDSIRSGCNTGAEDEPDLSKIGFSEEMYKAFAKGYICGFPKITEVEKENLLWGAILMTYECGMRFLTDYLDGDVYFHTTHDTHNLERARTQMKLVEIMESEFERLQSYTLSL